VARRGGRQAHCKEQRFEVRSPFICGVLNVLRFILGHIACTECSGVVQCLSKPASLAKEEADRTVKNKG
jgi:hypothetical protein